MRSRPLHLLVLAVLVLGGCGERPQAETVDVVNAGPSAAELLEIEKKSWNDWANKDADGIGNFLAVSFVDVSRYGAFDRTASLRRWITHECELSDISFSDEHVDNFADGVALLTYKWTGSIVCEGQPMPTPVHSATLYVHENGVWRASYYQDRIADGATGTVPPIQAGAEINIPGTTTADAGLVGLETQLWETWKQRDSNAFEPLLSDRFAGQSPIGRITKADMMRYAFDPACTIDSYALGPMAATTVAGGLVLITYRAEQSVTCGGDPLPSPLMVTSMYAREGGAWKSIFYMETPI
jgi:hypothetical protein